MSLWGGRDTDLIILTIPDANPFPAPPGHTRHAGQGDPRRLAEPSAPPPGTRPVVHKDPMLGVWSHGGGAAARAGCEACQALLEADP